MTCVELGAGAVLLGAVALALGAWHGEPPLPLPGARDAVLLLVLAFACTLLPFALSLVALRRLSAFQAQLAVNLEPVYAIVLAIVLLDEQRELTLVFYGGVAIVLLAVFARPLWQVRVRAAS